MKRKNIQTRTVRRSIAIPRELVDEAMRWADGQVGQNLNRLVRTALEDFVERRKQDDFERQMDCMGRDPSVREACRQLNREFKKVESDGLSRV